jgi:hypothetical protein
MSRCTQIPESRLFVFNPLPAFSRIVTALKARTIAHKTRTKFLLKFVRDIVQKRHYPFSLHSSWAILVADTNQQINRSTANATGSVPMTPQ